MKKFKNIFYISLGTFGLSGFNTFHNRTGASALKTAITEANINWQNCTSDNLNALGYLSKPL